MPVVLRRPVLPVDVWIDILVRLPYGAGKKAGRLNKSFRALLADPALATLSFQAGYDRDKAVHQYESGSAFWRHPLLHTVDWRSTADSDELVIRRTDAEKAPINLASLPARHEQAFAPAVARLLVTIKSDHPLPTVELVKPKGVTVGNVYGAWCEITSTPIPDHYDVPHEPRDDCLVCGDDHDYPQCEDEEEDMYEAYVEKRRCLDRAHTWGDLLRAPPVSESDDADETIYTVPVSSSRTTIATSS